MRVEVTFLVPSTTRAIGGVISLYEFANGLSRRGNRVVLVHLPVVDGHITSLDDVGWFPFDARIEHRLVASVDEMQLPPADCVELTALSFFADAWPPDALARVPREAGRPFLFVQAFRYLAPHIEAAAIRTPCPKLCVAHWMIDSLRKEGIPEEQLTFVPYGLDHAAYRLTRPIEDRPPQVTMLYNPHPVKGAQFGLDAIAEVRRRRPDVGAVVFGNREPLVEMPPGVAYVQSPPREVLVDVIYNRSSVFVCSSLREGFGLCAIEAMAGGCALVTTANGGSEEYAIPGETGLVCAPRDVTGMADRIERLLGDDALRVRVASAGRALVQERYDWDRSARELEQYLDGYAAGGDASWSDAV
jgi:glycosyltransferase involved in cell wall biosynthesis